MRFPHKRMFGLSLPPVVCTMAHVIFTLFVFVCALWCPMHSVLCFYFACRRLMYPMLPVSLCLSSVFTGRGKEDIKWREENIKGDEALNVVANRRDR
jgi:hypothetical protein